MKLSYKIDIADVLLVFLLMLMLLAQTSYMSVKLFLILFIGLINLIKGRYRPSLYNPVIIGVLFLIILSGAYRLASAIFFETMDTPGLVQKIPFLLIHPFLYYLLLPNMMGLYNHKKICNILVVGHLLILLFSFYNLYAVFNGMTPIQLSQNEETFIASEESVGISSGVVYQVMITSPIFFTLGFTKKIPKRLFVIGGLLTIVYSILTSRVTLMILVVLCLLIPLFLKICKFGLNDYWIIWKKLSVVSIVFVFFSFPIIYQVPLLEGIWQDVMAHFDSNEDIRYEQRQVLMDNWLESPVFGQGYGAKFKTSGKEGMQAAFESSYHLDLATTGVVGFGLFAMYILIILRNTYLRAKMCNDPYSMAVLLSLISLLIASITNPALSSFDRLLPIYLCIGFFADCSSRKNDVYESKLQ